MRESMMMNACALRADGTLKANAVKPARAIRNRLANVKMGLERQHLNRGLSLGNRQSALELADDRSNYCRVASLRAANRYGFALSVTYTRSAALRRSK